MGRNARSEKNSENSEKINGIQNAVECACVYVCASRLLNFSHNKERNIAFDVFRAVCRVYGETWGGKVKWCCGADGSLFVNEKIDNTDGVWVEGRM